MAACELNENAKAAGEDGRWKVCSLKMKIETSRTETRVMNSHLGAVWGQSEILRRRSSRTLDEKFNVSKGGI
jgi:hypothetical protein